MVLTDSVVAIKLAVTASSTVSKVAVEVLRIVVGSLAEVGTVIRSERKVWTAKPVAIVAASTVAARAEVVAH